MNSVFKYVRIILVVLIVIGASVLFFSEKPPLLQGIKFSTAVFDENGHLLRLSLSQDEKYRLFTPLSRMPSDLIEATLLQEDRYFRWHMGVNPISMLNAGWQTYVMHSRRLGASTISMQVARLRFGINSKTLSGKMLQIFHALQLERYYTKDQILEAYLNLAPYGGNIEGVGAASLIYFNKPIKQANLAEILTLSVMPQNPVHRTPQNNGLKNSRDKLFARWITQHPDDKDKQASIALPLQMQSLGALPFRAPHFVTSLLRSGSSGESLAGTNIHSNQEIVTTLDLSLQSLLERITRHYIKRKHNLGVFNASVLVVDTRDMGIKGLIGSVDFFDKNISGQINGTEIKRSPGSTLKPFIYGLALDQGIIHPNSVLKDVPQSFGSYNPENFDYDFMGPIKARDALVLSRNIPALYLANLLTKPSLFQFLVEAQISQLRPESYYGLSLALGGAELSMQELVGLYATLVNGGIWHPLRTRQNEPTDAGKRLLSPEASFLVLDMMKEPLSSVNSYTQNVVSWKTGTSSGYRDAWSVGSFGPYVMAVWIGNFDNRSNQAFVGKNIAAPLFFELIDAIRHEKGALPNLQPDPTRMNLTKIPVCKASGMLPTRFCRDTEMGWFIPGVSPIKTDTIFREVAIDNNTGLRTCHFDDNTRFEIFEFWPSDLLKLFKQAGIQRRIPPFFSADCAFSSNLASKPNITSPQTELKYVIQASSPEKNNIPLTAITDADVAALYWFINGTYLGKTRPDQPLLWKPKAGSYLVRVVDDHGLSDARDVQVALDN